MVKSSSQFGMMIIGIIIGASVVISCLIFLCARIYRRKRKRAIYSTPIVVTGQSFQPPGEQLFTVPTYVHSHPQIVQRETFQMNSMPMPYDSGNNLQFQTPSAPNFEINDFPLTYNSRTHVADSSYPQQASYNPDFKS